MPKDFDSKLRESNEQKLLAIKSFILEYRKRHSKDPMMDELAPFIASMMDRTYVAETIQEELSLQELDKKGMELVKKYCIANRIDPSQVKLVINPEQLSDALIQSGNPAIIYTPLKPGSIKFESIIRDQVRVIKKFIKPVSIVQAAKLYEWQSENRKILLKHVDLGSDPNAWETIQPSILSSTRLRVRVETKITLIDEVSGMEYSVTDQSPTVPFSSCGQSELLTDARMKLSYLVHTNSNEPDAEK